MNNRISNQEFFEHFQEKDSVENIKGKATLTFCSIITEEAKELERKIIAINKKDNWEEYRKLITELHSRFMIRQIVIDNLVTRLGRTILARLLRGDTTYSGEINYCALGTGDVASNTGQTILVTEKYRKQISSAAYSTYNTYISTFFSASETTGTYKEIGHFIDGGAGADSGQLWSRIADPETAELPITKTNIQSLTIDYSVTL